MEQETDLVDIGKELCALLIERVIAPAVARHMDLDVAVDLLKRSVVRELEDLGADKEIISEHLSRSTRWVFRWATQERTPFRMGATKVRPVNEDDSERSPGPGYKVMHETLRAFVEAYPEPLGVHDVSLKLVSSRIHIHPDALSCSLELYARMGHLTRILDDDQGARFKARHELIKDFGHVSRLEAMVERVDALLPLALSYVRGGPADFGHVAAKLTPSALVALQAKMRETLLDLFLEAVKRGNSEDEDAVEVRAIFAIGAVNKRGKHAKARQ